LLSEQWKKTKLPNGIEQFISVDEDTEVELMMLPTDKALIKDNSFRPWVEKYAEDKDLFFTDSTKVFAKLMELGIQRDEKGNVLNADNVKGGYISAPKKSPTAGAPRKTRDNEKEYDEASPFKQGKEAFGARL
jgi:cytochrome c peroxidase